MEQHQVHCNLTSSSFVQNHICFVGKTWEQEALFQGVASAVFVPGLQSMFL